MWIENSIPRVNVWHSEALPSDVKQWSQETKFSNRSSHSCLILFLAYRFISKVAFITTTMTLTSDSFKFDIIMTLQRRLPNDKVVWRPIQPRQTPNSCEKFLFGVRRHGWGKNFCPKRKKALCLKTVNKDYQRFCVLHLWIKFRSLESCGTSTNGSWLI